jgi:hypothetical protein
MMVETNSRNCILLKGPIGNRFDESGFARILKSDDGNLEFLVEEFGLDPGQDFIDEREHFYLLILIDSEKLLL